jgi:hypothetical protein
MGPCLLYGIANQTMSRSENGSRMATQRIVEDRHNLTMTGHNSFNEIERPGTIPDRGNLFQYCDRASCAAGAGAILSREEFGDCQLHLEFASPIPPVSQDQGRGNSGVMFFGRHEIQVLDCFNNLTYADGHAAAIYGQYPPLVNASRTPEEWQTYDIVFIAPRFKDDGTLESPASATVFHNGVVAHNHTALIGPMAFRALPHYRPNGPKGPILLQDHGNPVRFRNIRVRPVKGYDEG